MFSRPEAHAALKASPSAPANIPQNILEPILDRHLAAQSRAKVLRGWECVGLDQDASGVSVQIAGPDGERTEVRAQYVIACDGANSPIREALRISMEGVPEMARFLMVNCRGDLSRYAEGRPSLLYWNLNPESAGTFIVHDVASSFVYMYPFNADETEFGSAEVQAQAQELVRRAVGDEDFEFEVISTGRWVMRRELAQRYRDRRILLAGDAVHRFPPTGGLGMNTGFNDVHNLVWKLRAVLDGWASEGILDTYEAEAKPIAAANADLSLSNAVKMVEIPGALKLTGDGPSDRAILDRYSRTSADDPWRQQVQRVIDDQIEHFVTPGADLGRCYASAIVVDGDESEAAPNPTAVRFEPSTYPGIRLPHVWLEHDGQRASTLDVLSYDRFTLLVGVNDAQWRPAAEAAAVETGVPLKVVGIGGEDWAQVSGVGEAGAVLVRPDGHVAWRGASAQAAVGFAAILRAAAGQAT
jgi:2,4-dichlorophenol 6-monooxygenase